MEAFEPVVNLLALMSALSIAAERLANAVKLRDPVLAEKRTNEWEEKERERRIAQSALITSVALAMALKADFFQILAHLSAPWDTLGWVRATDTPWGVTRFIQTLGGTMVTGLSLSFGSKFWHDLLDIVYGARNTLRGVRAERRK